MKYILDTNSLNKHLIKRASTRRDVCIIQDVEDEHTSYGSNPSRVRGMEILYPVKKHLERLQELLKTEGDNFDIIRLYTGEGTADVMIIAFILAEREMPDTLFPDEYTIITKDKGLTEVATKYGIACKAVL